MRDRKKSVLLIALVVIFCGIMAVVDGIVKADYFIKSAIKLVLFLGFPCIYALTDKSLQIRKLFKAQKRDFGFAAVLGIAVYAVILGGYLLLKDVFDFSSITTSLTANGGVSRENFVFVSLYISFVNSLLEEFFFRGFAFLTLTEILGKKFAHIFSASIFALYHVAMMIGWFSFGVFAIVMVGLFAGGIIFNWLNAKSGSIYLSWLVHMFANFAINTIGFMLFGII